MAVPVVATNPLTTVSLLLTLAGLVGSFFNIQLSQWLRDLAALEQKVQLNRAQGDDKQRWAIVESHIELKRLSNGVTYAVSLGVVAFVLFVLVDGLLMIRLACDDLLYPFIAAALWVFLAFFVIASALLLIAGYLCAGRVRASLSPK